jgi:hypothetical protein
LVIELKVHAAEGVRQTERLADGYAHEIAPVFVFLTLHRALPLSDRFHPMRLRQFADDLEASLKSAPRAVGAHGDTARTAACDYLATLQRMNRMTALDDDAARLWLTHGIAMKEAEAASGRVLEHLTVALPGRLAQYAAQLKLGTDLVVRQEMYEYQSQKHPGRQPYPERAVVLARRSWLAADGTLRAGIGFGHRLRKVGQPEPDIDAFKTELRPFVGVFAPDQAVYAVYAALRQTPGRTWTNRWLSLQYAETNPSPGEGNLVDGLIDRILDQLSALWKEYSDRIDAAVRD